MGEAKRKQWAEEEQAAAAAAQGEAGPGIRLADQTVAPGAEPVAGQKRQARVEIQPDGSAARLTFGDGSVLTGAPEELVSHAEMILRVALQAFAQRAHYFRTVQDHLTRNPPAMPTPPA